MTIKRNVVMLDGVVMTTYPDGLFLVLLDNDMEVLAVISGKMRYRHIRIIRGDRVKVELTIYDLSRGRIIYRYRREGESISDLYG
uniref:Translation initiation factor IF-1, chloroplastic n=1 Tax=Cunninghamia lanceolata var. konishii TaxID=66170 RepID=A0A7R7I1N9_CUNLA|nr:translation initiation factor 1 [Cunninghamia lanceolata var. konishii]